MAKHPAHTPGLWSVISITVGTMLGLGILVLPGPASAIAGPWVGLSCVPTGSMVPPAVASRTEPAIDSFFASLEIAQPELPKIVRNKLEGGRTDD